MSTALVESVERPHRWRSWFRVGVVQAVIAVAVLNALVFALITPAFQVPDETAHFAYAQHLAETGERAGQPGHPEFSAEQTQAMAALNTLGVIGRPLSRPPLTSSDAQRADDALTAAADDASREDGGGPSTASSQPPLYYAVEAVPYRLFSWASLPTRVLAMRVLSAAIFAVGAGLCALFVAEALPGLRLTPLVGGIAVALSPYAAFVSSGITPDTLLLALSAATLLGFARAFRRGLTDRRAGLIALAVAGGLLTKLTYAAFVVPAVIVFVGLLWRDRAAIRDRGETSRLFAMTAAGAVVLPAVFLAYLAVSGQPLRPPGTGTPVLPVDQIAGSSLRELLSYAWQLFLPRLPFQIDQFGFNAPYEIWVSGYAGRYGWLDYSAPTWLAHLFRDVLYGVLALVIVAMVRRRRVVRRRFLELGAYSLFAIALALVVARSGYNYKRDTGLLFEQPRYLFPVAALYAATVAAACLALGRRFAPILAVVLVALFCLHDLSGVFLTLGRYYG